MDTLPDMQYRRFLGVVEVTEYYAKTIILNAYDSKL